MNVITASQLTKSFGPVTAVDSLSFSLAGGELFGLIGPDGAGKTTLLRMLATVMEPSGGTALVMGKDIVREADAVKEKIGYMSQRFGLYHDLTVIENLDFYADLFSIRRKERQERFNELLAFSNLEPFRNRQAGKLSGGMKQKLGLACALVHTPRLLLLDEPTNGVDPVSRREFWNILYRLLKRGVTILVSTSYLDEAERCHRVGLIDRGRLVACDRPAVFGKMITAKVLLVRTGNPGEVVSLIRSRIPGSSPTVRGNFVRIVSETPPEAIAALLKDHVPPDCLSVTEPSLEDLFVTMMERRKELGDGT